MEPTIQDTLQQLSALAGGSGMKKDKTSIYMMDQNKPIAPNTDEEGSNVQQQSNLSQYLDIRWR